MKHWLEVAVLFAALFLTGVDAKATAPNEDNVTAATAWVDAWVGQAYTVAASTKTQTCDFAAQELLSSFVRKTRTTLGGNISPDDARYLQDAAFIAGSIMKERGCGFVYKSQMSVLKKDIAKRFNQ